MLDCLADDVRAAGGMQLDLAGFSVVVAASRLRRGDTVAWWLFWCFQLLFLRQTVTTWIWPPWPVIWTSRLLDGHCCECSQERAVATL